MQAIQSKEDSDFMEFIILMAPPFSLAILELNYESFIVVFNNFNP